MADRRRAVLSEEGLHLRTLLQLQYELQLGAFGVDPINLRGQERDDYLRYNALALNKELCEALDETSWKPWASGSWINREQYLGELVDVLHFIANLLLLAVDPDSTAPIQDLATEVSARYRSKRQLNAKRQAEGYDGVSTKCPNCRRALDEVGSILTEGDGRRFCAVCGQHLKDET